MWSLFVGIMALQSVYSCVTNCISCPNNWCDKCIAGYYPNNGNCVNCNPLCPTCDWAEVCTSCITGYNLILGYCCDPRCSSCNFNQCWGCVDGYLYDGIRCSACPSTCTSCKSGQCVTGTGCPANCLECSTSTSCSKCESGYYPVTGGCSQCFSRCTTCDWLEVCTGCQTGFELIQGYCCDPKCSSCNQSKCWGCKDGYYYDGTNCITCPAGCDLCQSGGCYHTSGCSSHCNMCDNSGACVKCADGYYPDNGGCLQCNPNCPTCDWAEVCTSCVQGLELILGYCCDPKCSSCNLSKCWGCKDGYYFDGTHCLTCPANCDHCTGGLCYSNTLCPSNCLQCTDSQTCTKCSSGYYPVTGGCSKCYSTCSTCDWLEVCTSCVAPNVLISGYCCNPKCTSCNLSKCWGCADGYLYDGTSCLTCPSTCISCTAGKCNSLACPANCLTCTSSTCTKCATGYYPSSTGCAKCNARCTACDWAEVCTACATNYNLIMGYCCPVGCSSCNFKQCWGCISGYKLSRGTCVKI